jgi:acetyltransferase-like isoleucine patch superfamily enzyme
MHLWTRWHIAWADMKERKKLHNLYADMKRVGRNVHICGNYSISSREKITIGNNTWIGENFYVNGKADLDIGSGVIISRNVEIWTSNHNYNSDDLNMIPYDKRFINKPVKIGDNIWIGSRVIILPGVSIGEGAVIGAGSVVSHDIPPCAVVGGNPAHIVKYRNVEKYKELKDAGRIYLDMEYDYDMSSLRKTEYQYKNEPQ